MEGNTSGPFQSSTIYIVQPSIARPIPNNILAWLRSSETEISQSKGGGGEPASSGDLTSDKEPISDSNASIGGHNEQDNGGNDSSKENGGIMLKVPLDDRVYHSASVYYTKREQS